MKDHYISQQKSYLVLFSNTHVIFLRSNEHRLAETLRKQDFFLRNGTIEHITALPSGARMGKLYRHSAPKIKDLAG